MFNHFDRFVEKIKRIIAWFRPVKYVLTLQTEYSHSMDNRERGGGHWGPTLCKFYKKFALSLKSTIC